VMQALMTDPLEGRTAPGEEDGGWFVYHFGILNVAAERRLRHFVVRDWCCVSTTCTLPRYTKRRRGLGPRTVAGRKP